MILRGEHQEDAGKTKEPENRAISDFSAGGAAEVSPLRKEWVRDP